MSMSMRPSHVNVPCHTYALFKTKEAEQENPALIFPFFSPSCPNPAHAYTRRIMRMPAHAHTHTHTQTNLHTYHQEITLVYICRLILNDI